MRKHIAIAAALASAASFGFATPAAAQATRTWVSGVGDDVNPCSRTAPCKTFAGAISKTAAGGEINCLDPGGFGAVSIIKSMTIDCHYTEGGALAGGNGITVNLPAATDVVLIRGLDIFGVNPPTHGVRFIQLGTLIIQECMIRRFNAANSLGVSFAPTGAGKLYIYDSTIADNGNGNTGGGIEIKPAAGGVATAKVVIKNVRSINNANNGFRVDTTGNTVAPTSVRVTISDSDISGNANGIVGLQGVGASGIVMMIENSTVNNNSSFGILASGSGVLMRVANSSVTGNSTGVSATASSSINSYGTNRINGNTTSDGAFTGAVILQQ